MMFLKTFYYKGYVFVAGNQQTKAREVAKYGATLAKNNFTPTSDKELSDLNVNSSEVDKLWFRLI